ncbi:MAG TPA: hypothetical protein VK815_00745 [Candidatus Acidoferrales bacterium]|nr:hypothetical protein [Candidatus Acidoferrales bacterium]
MNTTLEKQNDALKRPCLASRKRVPSRLDAFAPQLVQMDGEKKTIPQILAWLQERDVTTSASNLSHFLKRRRGEAERKELQEQWASRANKCAAFEEWFAKNPKPDLGTVIAMFKLLIVELTASKTVAPEVLKLADKLAGTASRVEYRARKLVMEEDKHAEWKKDDEARALELCLKEADKHPAVAEMFRDVFIALKKAKGE